MINDIYDKTSGINIIFEQKYFWGDGTAVWYLVTYKEKYVDETAGVSILKISVSYSMEGLVGQAEVFIRVH